MKFLNQLCLELNYIKKNRSEHLGSLLRRALFRNMICEWSDTPSLDFIFHICEFGPLIASILEVRDEATIFVP